MITVKNERPIVVKSTVRVGSFIFFPSAVGKVCLQCCAPLDRTDCRTRPIQLTYKRGQIALDIFDNSRRWAFSGFASLVGHDTWVYCVSHDRWLERFKCGGGETPDDYETGESVVHDRVLNGGGSMPNGAITFGKIVFSPPEAVSPGIPPQPKSRGQAELAWRHHSLLVVAIPSVTCAPNWVERIQFFLDCDMALCAQRGSSDRCETFS